MQHYNVKIDAFEGPLDLLLHLINRLEIDIYDIPVAEITEQYLLYIHTMGVLELDIASEYLVMAATLLSIKSKMLLPKQEEELYVDEYGLEEENPMDELVEKLIEYRQFKEAAAQFKVLEQERGQMLAKPPSDLTEFAQEQKVEQGKLDVTIYDMLGAFQKLLRRQKLQKPLSTKITRQEIPIEHRMEEILTKLKHSRLRRNFTEFFPVQTREQLVVTFLAILELIKRQEVHIEQDHNFAEIFLSAIEKGDA